MNLSPEEERELEELIRGRLKWEELPPDSKAALGNSPKNWEAYILRYSLSHQKNWMSGLVRQYADARVYNDELTKISLKKYMLYPYHIPAISQVYRVTPFKYYLRMVHTLMKHDMSYDSLPNFTASDVVRIVGIGRNQYIDCMNAVRAKGWLWRQRRNPILELLPTEPSSTLTLEHWWLVTWALPDDDGRKLSESERALFDRLHTSRDWIAAGELDHFAVHALYRRGLLLADIPVTGEDTIVLPPLEGFVMNRVLGDYFENLLYQIFIAVDERTTIAELAKVLQIDLESVCQAISAYIRLGFAKKKNPPAYVSPLDNPSSRWHPSWASFATNSASSPTSTEVIPASNTTSPSNNIDDVNNINNPATPPASGRMNDNNNTSVNLLDDVEVTSSPSSPSSVVKQPILLKIDPSGEDTRRIALLFDSTITAYLMMGNLAPGLKTHAVTMFEVGKLPEETMPAFMAELETIQPVGEGEAQRYVDHALCLRQTLQHLRAYAGVDLIRCERINSLEEPTRLRLLERSYKALVAMAPLSADAIAGSRPVPRLYGPAVAEMNSLWFHLYCASLCASGSPLFVFPMGSRISELPRALDQYDYARVMPWGAEPSVVRVVSLLVPLNDWLCGAPVAVQAYSLSGREPMVRRLPFPFDAQKAGANDAFYPGGGVHPAAVALHEKLELGLSFGYMTFVNPRHEEGVMEAWEFQSVAFGVPLFEMALNRKVCEALKDGSLFEKDSMERHDAHAHKLTHTLYDFIEQCQLPGKRLEIQANSIPYPTRHIRFENHSLHFD